jgi:1,2-diacylglycerol 3-alpha-glucosyltransferase
MDAFAFASLSETQGMVLTEAMAAGVPVVALSAPGVDDVVRDEANGRLLRNADREAFAAALRGIAALSMQQRQVLRKCARQTAEAYALTHTADVAIEAYQALLARPRVPETEAHGAWRRTLRLLRSECDPLAGMADGAP